MQDNSHRPHSQSAAHRGLGRAPMLAGERVVLAGLLGIAALGLTSACIGEIRTEGPGSSADAGLPAPIDAGPGSPSSAPVAGPPVLPHVQVFADAVCGAVGACQPSTYDGHHPSAELAVDILVSDTYGSLPSDANALGDALGEYAVANLQDFGIWYVIWRQRINYGDGWESMEDRGSITQNHYDHVHVSFDEVAP